MQAKPGAWGEEGGGGRGGSVCITEGIIQIQKHRGFQLALSFDNISVCCALLVNLCVSHDISTGGRI